MSYEMVVAGASLGGFHALQTMLGGLTTDFQTPIAVVQHRSIDSDELLELLGRVCHLPIDDVEDKQPISPGRVYIAPANYHLLVEPGHFALSVDDPVLFARPSIDVLFQSAADAYGSKLIGVLLSGANEDGAQGIAAIKLRGGLTIVQDPASAESEAMPAAALAATRVDYVLPLNEIAPALSDLVSRKGD